MLKKLRILFTILSAVAIALAFPMAFIFDWAGLGVCAVIALIFFILMLLCKQAQEEKEPKMEENDEISNDKTNE